MRVRTQQTNLLAAAGWRLKRVGKHAVWHCPCGQHIATVSTSRARDWRSTTIVRGQIRRCEESK